MLRIDNLTYRIGARVLFDQADAAINPGHRVGLVGRNGTGKTTLLNLIMRTLTLDGGAIEMPSRWRIGMTSQEAPGGNQSLIDTVLATDSELAALTAEAETATDGHRIAEIHERLGDMGAWSARARAARILAGLGFNEAAQQRPCSEFSGGWRMRVALAALLFTEPDLLLLDEPTNHLDLEASLWLEDYLRRYPGTILLVSHDRDLLNRSVDEILHLEGRKLTLYQGNYDRFQRTRRMRLELDGKMRVKQDAKRAHLQKFVERFRYKASKAKQAQSRIKMLERMEPVAERHGEGSVHFDFPDPGALAPPLYSIDRVAVGYDGKPVLNDLALRLDEDDRIALLGANGNGKSTLIKLLAGRLEAMSGHVTRSGKLRVGYFAQHQADELDLDATPLIELGRRRTDDNVQQLRSQLGRFGFSQGRADTRIGSLSGGEKARLLFALMSCNAPHILLLDEPTNHLDVESREALIQALNIFAGAVVIVSHDPHLIELIADRLWLVDGGGVQPYDGDMEDYRALLLDQTRNGNGNGGAAEGNGRQAKRDKKDQRREAAERRKALAPLRKKLDKAEKAVHRLEADKAGLEAQMADPELYDGESLVLADLRERLGKVAKELAAAEKAWMDIQEEYDQAGTHTAN
ncbi:MAG: ABC-F family ATP-binding cassette domain-containing protein [Alphaproteobacteria bacterium]